jgi:hypothetical protein
VPLRRPALITWRPPVDGFCPPPRIRLAVAVAVRSSSGFRPPAPAPCRRSSESPRAAAWEPQVAREKRDHMASSVSTSERKSTPAIPCLITRGNSVLSNASSDKSLILCVCILSVFARFEDGPAVLFTAWSKRRQLRHIEQMASDLICLSEQRARRCAAIREWCVDRQYLPNFSYGC